MEEPNKYNKLELIGIAGVNGSGKDTFGEMLAAHHGYLFISVTDLLRNEAARRELEPEREILRTISAEWRSQYGVGVLVDRALNEYEIKKKNGYNGLVMASIRNPGEVDYIHKLGGVVIWLDASPKVRYERIQKNAVERGRAVEDLVSYEKFLSDEEIEMHPANPNDENVLNLAEVRNRCDAMIANDSNDLEYFRKLVESSLGLGNIK